MAKVTHISFDKPTNELTLEQIIDRQLFGAFKLIRSNNGIQICEGNIYLHHRSNEGKMMSMTDPDSAGNVRKHHADIYVPIKELVVKL